MVASGALCCKEPSVQPDSLVVLRSEAIEMTSGFVQHSCDSEPAVVALANGNVAKRPCENPWWAQQGLNCGMVPIAGPDVEVVDITARMATVRWTNKKGCAPKAHYIDICRLSCSRGERKRVASFEVDGQAQSFELPLGTLKRACGPYTAEVMTCTIDGDMPSFSDPGVSEPFWTQPEAPGPVVGPEVYREPTDRDLCIRWGAPIDDGGSPVEEYELALVPLQTPQPVSLALSAELLSSSDPPMESTADAPVHVWVTCKQGCVHTFSGLPPGRPFRAEVRAMSAAGFIGPSTWVEAATVVAAPSAPSSLTACLLQGDAAAACNGSTGDDDLDLVRIEFSAPLKDGGRPIESYLIYATVERGETIDDPALEMIDLEGLDAGRPGLRPLPLCNVLASDAASPDEPVAGCRCACNVAVAPNHTYTFAVVPFNGTLTGATGEPAPCVFVPPRRPRPPRLPPQVRRIEEGLAAELHWVSPQRGGGLPILSFKIGILSMDALVVRSPCETSDIQREMVVDSASAKAAAYDSGHGIEWQGPVRELAQQASFAARVEGLEAESCYLFVLAATNAQGTSPWSVPSRPAWTLTYLAVRQAECPVPRWIQDTDRGTAGWDPCSTSFGQWIERGILARPPEEPSPERSRGSREVEQAEPRWMSPRMPALDTATPDKPTDLVRISAESAPTPAAVRASESPAGSPGVREFNMLPADDESLALVLSGKLPGRPSHLRCCCFVGTPKPKSAPLDMQGQTPQKAVSAHAKDDVKLSPSCLSASPGSEAGGRRQQCCFAVAALGGC